MDGSWMVYGYVMLCALWCHSVPWKMAHIVVDLPIKHGDHSYGNVYQSVREYPSKIWPCNSGIVPPFRILIFPLIPLNQLLKHFTEKELWSCIRIESIYISISDAIELTGDVMIFLASVFCQITIYINAHQCSSNGPPVAVKTCQGPSDVTVAPRSLYLMKYPH